MRRLRILVLLAVLFVSNLVSAGAQALQPASTWAFVVGLYHFAHPAVYPNFVPADERVDDRLVATLFERGVPPSHIVHLVDHDATRSRIYAALRRLLHKTAPGDTLLIYFGTHGDRDDQGQCYVIPYDGADDSSSTSISCRRLLHLIDGGFRGSRVLLALDTCNSGGMVDALKRVHTRASFACLASCLANEESSDWDFTECLIDGLRGQPMTDLDGDGRVTLEELAQYMAGELAYGQEQIATWYRSPSFPPAFVLSTVSGLRPSSPVGEHVEVKDDGKWYKARIVEAMDGRVRVHFYGNGDDSDEWVAAADVRAHRAAQYDRGTQVLVLDDDADTDPFPATVVASKGEVFLVKYSDGQEEWVEGRRLRAR